MAHGCAFTRWLRLAPPQADCLAINNAAVMVVVNVSAAFAEHYKMSAVIRPSRIVACI